jgi:Cys-rich protein (TIGR01571 family)
MKFAVITWVLAALVKCGKAAILHSSNSGKTISSKKPSEHKETQTAFHTTGLNASQVHGAHVLNNQSTEHKGIGAPCEDRDQHCPEWARNGDCESNPSYMLAHCELSCGVCSGDKLAIGPLAKGHIKPTSSGTEYGIHVKDASLTEMWLGNLGTSVESYVPYAIMMFIIAFIWEELGGNLPPQFERKPNPRGFAYGLFSTEHCLDGHMWIGVCSFCCFALRTADNYSKTSAHFAAPKPIISSFWLALAFMLLLQFFACITGGLGWILAVAVAVYFRQKIRQMYGLPNCTGEVLAWDCLFWCCCPWCTVAQEARQVQFVVGDSVQVTSSRVIAHAGESVQVTPAQVPLSGQVYNVPHQVMSAPAHMLPTSGHVMPGQVISGRSAPFVHGDPYRM